MDAVFTEFWNAAKQAGPFASLLLLAAVWALNAERKKLQEVNNELVERFIKLAIDTSNSMKDLRDLFYKTKEK